MANLSIIIPTLNEEDYLPLLLESIKRQQCNFDYEIIVADAGSKDKTLEIAKRFGAKVIKGGLPAKGRNEGAKVAQGNLLLFLDADTKLPENSLKKLLAEFEERKLDISSCLLQPFGSSKMLRFLYNLFYNLPILIMEKILPHAAGFILIKKELYQKIGGFDEKIKLAEDHSFARKAAKFGRFGILRSAKIFYSQRRFEKEGWLKIFLKYFLAEIYLCLFGKIYSDIFKYRFQVPKK